jgi:hypothetical protein
MVKVQCAARTVIPCNNATVQQPCKQQKGITAVVHLLYATFLCGRAHRSAVSNTHYTCWLAMLSENCALQCQKTVWQNRVSNLVLEERQLSMQPDVNFLDFTLPLCACHFWLDRASAASGVHVRVVVGLGLDYVSSLRPGSGLLAFASCALTLDRKFAQLVTCWVASLALATSARVAWPL